MSSEQVVTPEVSEAPAPQPKTGRGLSSRWFLLIGAVIVFNIVALILVPPFPRDGAPGDACAFPVCFIEGTLEFPAPHVVWAPEGSTPPPASELITFYPSISSTILTMWIVMAIVLIVVDPDGPRLEADPGPRPERLRVVLRVPERLRPRHRRPDGQAVHPAVHRVLPADPVLQLERPHPAGRPDRRAARARRATSTSRSAWRSSASSTSSSRASSGSASAATRGKFFPLYEFKNGIAAGGIALFVGLVELMLEFVKPVTLSMRLFGNIYGGEVALGVITALTIAFIPVGLLGLEVMLNAIQALIFSILTLMFIVLAIESHGHEEGHVAEEALNRPHGNEPEFAPEPAH